MWIFKDFIKIGLGLILVVLSETAFSKEFEEETEKDYSLRSIGKLQVTNPKGDILIQGWALDKIRVKVRKSAVAETSEKAKKLLDLMDYRYQMNDGNIEISTQYGKGLSIQDRLKEEGLVKTHFEVQISAPSNLKLKLWTVDGKVLLKNWNHNAEIRNNTGSIKVEGVKADELTLVCASCSVQLRNIRSKVRCMGGAGSVDMANVYGKSIYVETQSGFQKMVRIEGDQLYVTQSGSIDGHSLSGRIEFRSKQGQVDFREISGFLSGSVESGNISVQIREWSFLDKAFIEAIRGNIHLILPRRFSGNVDIWSLQGKASSEFSIEKIPDLATFGPEPTNHLTGRINEGGDLLKVTTEQGNIEVQKGKF